MSAARCSPSKNSPNHLPVSSVGNAKLNRKQRGMPPIAAMSLTARARHFQPTESAGCLFRKKWVPSSDQWKERMVSCPGGGRKSAASSPMASDSGLEDLFPARAFNLENLL